MPLFAPLRVRGGRYGLWWAVRRRRRAMAAALAMAAAAMAASGFREPSTEAGPEARRADRAAAVRTGPPGLSAAPAGQRKRDLVSAPVRIADGETVRLLRPGDRVDVIAAPATPAGTSAEDDGPQARILASGVRVTAVPRREGEEEGAPPDGLGGPAGAERGDGALLVLAVPRAAAADLVAASATARLAVVLC
ncbi:RcpC/CpaB family pilus assembly protein [Streptomyces sp. TRM76323]|uniref:RcpC/CpaB family pilus assembly protein n=1 Tax=Streptomyces tamarix TaxID=3078565 RepID=A0ABU3QSL0_9ACTN|nr:RcpC/CpaB family pilus assembly protein [Streptomyces tamarix]MDT9685739.1 RcpC/CpaB family pilus assembly protein [Streptomyces tamarix]